MKKRHVQKIGEKVDKIFAYAISPRPLSWCRTSLPITCPDLRRRFTRRATAVSLIALRTISKRANGPMAKSRRIFWTFLPFRSGSDANDDLRRSPETRPRTLENPQIDQIDIRSNAHEASIQSGHMQSIQLSNRSVFSGSANFSR